MNILSIRTEIAFSVANDVSGMNRPFVSTRIAHYAAMTPVV